MESPQIANSNSQMEMNDFAAKSLKEEWDELMKDPWLVKKTDRARRIKEISAYIANNCADEFMSEGGLIVDVGPGPGEFLEIARYHGNDIMGVDAPTGDGGMGNAYVRASRLMHIRQNIPVMYQRFTLWLCAQHASTNPCRPKLINFRGSIEQCFSKQMHGPPHHLHQDCSKLSWKEDGATEDAIRQAFKIMHDLLVDGGAILIHANGAKNFDWFKGQVLSLAHEIEFECVKDDERLMKWRR